MQTEFYKRYIRSIKWKKKAAERIEYDGRKCRMCNRPESTCRNGLSVHHISYKNLGHESLNEIISLCPGCHQKLHRYLNAIKEKD